MRNLDIEVLTDLLKAPEGVLVEPERKARSSICEPGLGLPGACAFGRKEDNRSTLILSAER